MNFLLFLAGVVYALAGMRIAVFFVASTQYQPRLHALMGKGAAGAFLFCLLWPAMAPLVLLCSVDSLQVDK